MMRLVSDGISKWLAFEGVIVNSDQNLYSYAAYSFFLGMLPVAISVALGLIFGILLESVLLLVPFMLLRKFCGGFHFASVRLCLTCSTALIAVSLEIVKILMPAKNGIPLLICVVLSATSLFANSPIETVSRKLSEKERVFFRLFARILTFAMVQIFFVLLCLESSAQIPIGIGIIVTAVLQIPCIPQKMYSNKKS